MSILVRSALGAIARRDVGWSLWRAFSVAGPSPLQQIPTTVTPDGTTQPLPSENRTAKAFYRQLPISSKKLTFVAKLVRKMRVEDALLQCDLVHKKASFIVQNAIRSAAANGEHNHGLDRKNLFIEHCFATNGTDLKRIAIHGKGKSGKIRKRRTHLTIILKEDMAQRPRPHRLVDTWIQREMKRELTEKKQENPQATVHRSVKTIQRKLKWTRQLKRHHGKLKVEKKYAKRRQITEKENGITESHATQSTHE